MKDEEFSPDPLKLKVGPFRVFRDDNGLFVRDTDNDRVLYSTKHIYDHALIHGLPRVESKMIKNSLEYGLYKDICKKLYSDWSDETGIDYVGLLKENIEIVRRRRSLNEMISGHRAIIKDGKARLKKKPPQDEVLKIRCDIMRAKASIIEYREGKAKLPPEDPEIKKGRAGYHGTKSASKKFVNYFMKSFVKDIDAQVLKQSRRYPPPNRGLMFKFFSQNERLAQFGETFPLISFMVASNASFNVHFDTEEELLTDDWASDKEAQYIKRMIEDGFSIKKILAKTGVPKSFRKIKPQCCPIVNSNYKFFHTLHEKFPKLFDDFMPTKTMEQYRWIKVLSQTAIDSNRPNGWEFTEWLGRAAVPKIGSNYCKLASRLYELKDGFVNEPWDKKVDWEGGERRQAEWHVQMLERQRLEREVRAQAERENQILMDKFPEPWLPDKVAVKDDEYSILAIKTQEELYEEGDKLHHCVGSYGGQVRRGNCYLYSVRKGKDRVGTVEVRKNVTPVTEYAFTPTSFTTSSTKYMVSQFRGLQNVDPPADAIKFVNSWVRKAPQQEAQQHEVMAAQ